MDVMFPVELLVYFGLIFFFIMVLLDQMIVFVWNIIDREDEYCE